LSRSFQILSAVDFDLDVVLFGEEVGDVDDGSISDIDEREPRTDGGGVGGDASGRSGADGDLAGQAGIVGDLEGCSASVVPVGSILSYCKVPPRSNLEVGDREIISRGEETGDIKKGIDGEVIGAWNDVVRIRIIAGSWRARLSSSTRRKYDRTKAGSTSSVIASDVDLRNVCWNEHFVVSQIAIRTVYVVRCRNPAERQKFSIRYFNSWRRLRESDSQKASQ